MRRSVRSGLRSAFFVSFLAHALLALGGFLSGWFTYQAPSEGPDASAQVDVLVGGDGGQREDGYTGSSNLQGNEQIEMPSTAMPAPDQAEQQLPERPVAVHDAAPTKPLDSLPPQAQPSQPADPEPGQIASPSPPPPPSALRPSAAQPASPTGIPDVNLGDGILGAGSVSSDDETLRPATADPTNLGPQYPPEAGRRGEQGTVLVRMHIDEIGLVTRVEILRSSGYPQLDRSAQMTLRTWKFKPAMKEGRAVPDSKDINVDFKLR